MTTTTFALKYVDNVGFAADQGGRGFLMPTAMVPRGDGRIFVASRSNNTARTIVGIQAVTRRHDFFGQIGGYGSDPGQMIWPSALALDSEDNLYLADDFLNRITVYDGEGEVVSTWGVKGSGDGQIDGPSGLLFDRRGQPAGGGPQEPPNPEVHQRRQVSVPVGLLRQQPRPVQPYPGASPRTGTAMSTSPTGATTASRSSPPKATSSPPSERPATATVSSIDRPA